MTEPKISKISKGRKTRASVLKADQEAEWRKQLDQGTKAAKTYAMDKTYVLDDRVDHQTFGVGVVVSLIPPDKINVFFQDGLKMMKCGG